MEIVEEGVSSDMLIDNLYILLLKVFRKKGMCNFSLSRNPNVKKDHFHIRFYKI